MRWFAFLLATFTVACNGKSDEEILDGDDDGYLPADIGYDDCNDRDPAVHPGAPEVCGDAVDNDCDGRVDDAGEGDQEFWFDGDGDGLGDPGRAGRACEAGSDQVPNADDCDDANASVGEKGSWFTDDDGDGVGTGAATLTCPGSGLAAVGGDCDDRDPAIGAGEPELLFVDADLDGVGAGAAVQACPQPGYVATDGDCDDADGTIGEPSKFYTDADLDGFGTGQPQISCPAEGLSPLGTDCDDTRPDILDVVATTLYRDFDGDTYGGGDARTTCPQPGYVAAGGDCDDLSPAVNPGEPEVTCTGVDDDCSAATPDGPVYDALGAYATIQEGLDLGTGDLTVCDGRYFESLVVSRAVSIAPEPGAAVEILPLAGPALLVQGGGIVTVSGVTLWAGTGVVHDGMLVGGTVASLDPATTLTLTETLVEPGDADFGGNIAALGPLVLADTSIAGGTVAGDGGCVWAAGNLTLLGDTTIADCTAAGSGGAIWLSADGLPVTLTADDAATITTSKATDGGGIWAGAGSTVVLGAATRLYDNQATGSGGGAWMEGLSWSGGVLEANDATAGDGGGMVLEESAILGVTFAENTASRSGGAVSGSGEVNLCTFALNKALGGDGGAIAATGDLDVTGSVFELNNSTASGGAIWSDSTLVVTDGTFLTNNAEVADGGAIRGGAVSIGGTSTFIGNSAGTNGGAVRSGGSARQLTLAGTLTWEGNSAASGGAIHHTGVRSIIDPYALPQVDGTGSTFTGNFATTGGAVWVDGVWWIGGAFEANTATDGGAMRAGGAYLEGGVFTSNSATDRGGAVFSSNLLVDGGVFTTNSALNGGAIGNDFASWLILLESDFTGNTALEDGGAVRVGGGDPVDKLVLDRLSIDGGSFTGNSAGDAGGAVWVAGTDLYVGVSYDLVPVQLGVVTFTGNAAGGDGGAISSRGTCPAGALGCDPNPTMGQWGAIFTLNHADEDGGAWWSNHSVTSVEGRWTENDAGDDGGAFSCADACFLDDDESVYTLNTATDRGGALFLDMALGGISDALFDQNSASNGGAIAATSVGYYDEFAVSACDDCNFLDNDALGFGGKGGILYLDGTPGGSGKFNFDDSTFDSKSAPEHVETLSTLGVVHTFKYVGVTDVNCTAKDGCL